MEKKQENLVAVIMAGGAGTRFWPLSTNEKPKQFLSLFGSRTLLQKSFDRIIDLVNPERILVLTSSNFAHYVEEQLPQIPLENIVREPIRKDTAAAITIASLLIKKKFGNSIAAILTADHLIEPVEAFHNTLISAAQEAQKHDVIYTFGIHPTYPATCYGYLELGKEIYHENQIGHFQLVSFKEKPAQAIARQYLEKGNFCWNSGMFVASAETLLQQIQKFLPEHVSSISRAVQSYNTPDWESELLRSLQQISAISIDFGVMEKADNLRCVLASFCWNDVGGWLALEEYLEKDGAQNSYCGRLHILDAKHNLVFCENHDETVVLIGVKDLVVVRTEDRTLIVDRHRAEEIKKIVSSLSQTNR